MKKITPQWLTDQSPLKRANPKGPVDWLDVNSGIMSSETLASAWCSNMRSGNLLVWVYLILQKKDRVSLINSAAGYDILSFCPDNGDERFIEVKTNRGGTSTPFYIS